MAPVRLLVGFFARCTSLQSRRRRLKAGGSQDWLPRKAASRKPHTPHTEGERYYPRAHSPGSRSPINQPRNGAKDAPEPGFLRPVPGLTRPARGSQCWRTGLCSCVLGLGSRKNRRGLRRKQRHVIRFVQDGHQNQEVCGIRLESLLHRLILGRGLFHVVDDELLGHGLALLELEAERLHEIGRAHV